MLHFAIFVFLHKLRSSTIKGHFCTFLISNITLTSLSTGSTRLFSSSSASVFLILFFSNNDLRWSFFCGSVSLMNFCPIGFTEKALKKLFLRNHLIFRFCPLPIFKPCFRLHTSGSDFDFMPENLSFEIIFDFPFFLFTQAAERSSWKTFPVFLSETLSLKTLGDSVRLCCSVLSLLFSVYIIMQTIPFCKPAFCTKFIMLISNDL